MDLPGPFRLWRCCWCAGRGLLHLMYGDRHGRPSSSTTLPSLMCDGSQFTATVAAVASSLNPWFRWVSRSPLVSPTCIVIAWLRVHDLGLSRLVVWLRFGHGNDILTVFALSAVITFDIWLSHLMHSQGNHLAYNWSHCTELLNLLLFSAICLCEDSVIVLLQITIRKELFSWCLFSGPLWCRNLLILLIAGWEDWSYSMDVEAIKKMNVNKNLIKKYNAFLTSEAIIKQLPCLLGPGLNMTGKCSVCHILVTRVSAGWYTFWLLVAWIMNKLSSVLDGYVTCSCSPARSPPPGCATDGVFVGAHDFMDVVAWHLYAPDLKA
jgi:hypothetical protein